MFFWDLQSLEEAQEGYDEVTAGSKRTGGKRGGRGRGNAFIHPGSNLGREESTASFASSSEYLCSMASLLRGCGFR